jgi:hypothetical protein
MDRLRALRPGRRRTPALGLAEHRVGLLMWAGAGLGVDTATGLCAAISVATAAGNRRRLGLFFVAGNVKAVRRKKNTPP